MLHPQSNRWLGSWDIVTTLALLYTAVVTPFEASFLPSTFGTGAWTDGWFLVNRLLDVIFLCDMVLQFFVAYESRDERGGAVWIDSPKRIIRNYLRSWFALDAFTIFVPLGFDLYQAVMPAPTDGDDGGGGFAANMSLLRVLRVVRLVKLVRLIRASRVFERWKTRISLSHGSLTIIRSVTMLVLGAHW